MRTKKEKRLEYKHSASKHNSEIGANTIANKIRASNHNLIQKSARKYKMGEKQNPTAGESISMGKNKKSTLPNRSAFTQFLIQPTILSFSAAQQPKNHNGISKHNLTIKQSRRWNPKWATEKRATKNLARAKQAPKAENSSIEQHYNQSSGLSSNNAKI